MASRGDVWSTVRGALGRLYPDLIDQEMIRNDANASTIADAIIAAIGTPDATGDLLMRAAENNYILLEGPDAEIPRWKVNIYPDPMLDVVFQSERPTPADAIRAALAAAEEEGR